MTASAFARGAWRALCLCLALGGCASREVIYHHLPADTPAADNAAQVKAARALAAAAESAKRAPGAPAPTAAEPAVTPADAPPLTTYDPLGRLNRFTYRFNARFDEAIFLPAANTYRRVLPRPLRTGVNNFFYNLSEVDTVINYTLQGRLGRGVHSLGRFVINSTLGLGGLFDPATRLHLAKQPTGFGTTLAKWGMHPGFYLVVPFYGPSTLREGIGLAGDYATSYGVNLADLYRGNQSWGLGVLNAVDERANIDFRYYASGSPFEYEAISFLYVRKLLIQDSGLHPPHKRDQDVPAGE